VKIYLLDNGSIVIDHAQLMWNIGGGTPVRIPSYGLLIEHDDGLFVFDTGFDLDHTNAVLPFELPEQTPEQTIPAQLRACGVEPSDVTTLVNSHLHFDHVGGNKHLAEATVVVHERELEQLAPS
jgi:4-pyridoxolactonase